MRLVCILSALFCAWSFVSATPSAARAPGLLQVSDDGRGIVDEEGEPFFYLSDTNWELFPRSRREDVEFLLEARRRQGFTVIAAPIAGLLDGAAPEDALARPNMYGDLAFASADVTRPIETPGADPDDPNQYDYWDHIDCIIDLAGAKGMYVALFPGWRIHYELGLINEQNARAYGQFLGRRFGARSNIIWVLGGDTNIERGDEASLGDQLREDGRRVWRLLRQRHQRNAITPRVFRELAAGIRETESIRHLMTYHPAARGSSAAWFHQDEWLDFNMIQSGHEAYDIANYERITADYARTPVKPAMDGESRYEDHAVAHRPERGWFGDFDVRQAAYWSLFAGAHGHAYGNRGVWQMYEPGRDAYRPLRYYWYDAVRLPGAQSMRHVRDLMVARPMFGRVPDQTLLRDALAGGSHMRATRGDGYAFIYSPSGANIEVRMDAIDANQVVAWWFDPRSGVAAQIGRFRAEGWRVFDPPGEPALGNDWVLVVDDVARGFPPPGAASTSVLVEDLVPGAPVDRPTANAGAPPNQNFIAAMLATLLTLAALLAPKARRGPMRT